MCTFIEGFGDIFKSLLTSGIPNIKGDGLSLGLDPFYFEVDSDGAEIIGLKCVLAVANEQAGLTNPTVADDQVFEGCAFVFGGH